jgi:hypothetical protein
VEVERRCTADARTYERYEFEADEIADVGCLALLLRRSPPDERVVREAILMSSNKRIRASDAPRRRGPTAADIIDKVLDRGVLTDYHSRVSLGGIDALVTMDGQSVVTSSKTNLEYAAPFRTPTRLADARPRFDGPADPVVYAPVASERRPRRSAPERKRRKR